MPNLQTYKAWCKATNREDSEPRYSQNWVAAKRAWFRVYPNRIECGDWSIPFEEVKKTIVYRTHQMWIPVTVLHLITENGSFQFGFNPWANPIKHLSLDFEEQKVRLKYSLFSIVLRVVVVLYLCFWLWQEYGKT